MATYSARQAAVVALYIPVFAFGSAALILAGGVVIYGFMLAADIAMKLITGNAY